jgi:hypothetical protein
MGAPHYTPSGKPTSGAPGSSEDLRDEFSLIEAGIEVLNEYPIYIFFDDLNTAESRFAVMPSTCVFTAASASISVNNSTTDTIITFEIGGVLVTMDSGGELTIPSNGIVGGVYGPAVPASGNALAANQAIEIITDGGGSSVMPGYVMLTIKRT